VTQTNQPLLLLSGAGLPAWIWTDSIGALGESFPAAVAQRPSNDNATLRDYALAALESAPWDNFVIVAHSLGGVVGAELVRHAPERVSAFLGVSAVIPRPGASFVTSMPLPNRIILSLAMRISGTRPPDSALRKLAAGVDEGAAKRLIDEFAPESLNVYTDKLQGHAFPAKRGYISTNQDNELPENLQKRFVSNLDPTWQDSMSTGHLPMLEAPADFAENVQLFAQA
jgi:pimeloyl-ACP methyl ester carboxylesterase